MKKSKFKGKAWQRKKQYSDSPTKLRAARKLKLEALRKDTNECEAKQTL